MTIGTNDIGELVATQNPAHNEVGTSGDHSSGDSQTAFNDAPTSQFYAAQTNSTTADAKTAKPKWLYLVTMFAGPDDDIGHAFVVFEDDAGGRKGFGFWPDHALNMGEQGLFLGSGYFNTDAQPFDGKVKDEATTRYLDVFNSHVTTDWVSTNHSNVGVFTDSGIVHPGSYAFLGTALDENKFQSAMDVEKVWSGSPFGYGPRCMCGSFAQQVMSAAGVNIGPTDMRFATPRNLYRDITRGPN